MFLSLPPFFFFSFFNHIFFFAIVFILVCDFGFARSVSRRQLMTVCGTGEWMAPEVFIFILS